MKSNVKKFLVLLSMLACVFSITACDNVSKAKTSSSKTLTYDEETVKSSIATDLKSISDDYTEEQLTTMMDSSDEVVATLFSNWIKVKKDLGKFVEISSYEFNATSTTLSVDAHCTYSNRNAVFSIAYDSSGTISSSSFSVEYTMSEKVGKAGLNTVIAMSVVFAVLFLISVLISSFQYINKFENRARNKKTDVITTGETVDNSIAQIMQNEVDEMNDLELVAVITAAIAASQETSSDSFVVRSIKKSNKSKWQRA